MARTITEFDFIRRGHFGARLISRHFREEKIESLIEVERFVKTLINLIG